MPAAFHVHGMCAEDLARGVGRRGGKWRRARLFSPGSSPGGVTRRAAVLIRFSSPARRSGGLNRVQLDRWCSIAEAAYCPSGTETGGARDRHQPGCPPVCRRSARGHPSQTRLCTTHLRSQVCAARIEALLVWQVGAGRLGWVLRHAGWGGAGVGRWVGESAVRDARGALFAPPFDRVSILASSAALSSAHVCPTCCLALERPIRMAPPPAAPKHLRENAPRD